MPDILCLYSDEAPEMAAKGEAMNKVDRAQQAGINAEEETVRLAKTLERAALEKEYAFLAGQNAYLSMCLTATQGMPRRDAGDALRCLAAIPLQALDEAATGTSRAKFLQLVDVHRDNILLALFLLRKIATGVEKVLDVNP